MDTHRKKQLTAPLAVWLWVLCAAVLVRAQTTGPHEEPGESGDYTIVPALGQGFKILRGGKATFKVTAPCSSDFTASSADPAIADVSPKSAVGKDQFDVAIEGKGVGVTSIELKASSRGSCKASLQATGLVNIVDYAAAGFLFNSATLGDPVSAADGTYYDSVRALYLPGPLPLGLMLYYASSLGTEERVASALGANWMHSFDPRLEVTGPKTCKIQFHRGQSLRFDLAASGWVQSSNDPLQYPLLQSGGEFRLLDPASGLIYAFNAAAGGRLERVADRNGNTVTLTYSGGLLSGAADGLGRSLAFTYAAGRLTGVRDHAGRQVSFGYAGDLLASFTDAAGAVTRYSYTTAGTSAALMVSRARPRGNTPYTQTYDSSGRVSSQKDAAGNSSTLSFSSTGFGLQTTASDPLSQTSRYVHQARNLTGFTDPERKATAILYDRNNRQISHTDREGARTTMTYHAPTGLLESVTRGDSARYSWTYAPASFAGFTFYNLASISFPDNTSERYEYDSQGNLTARTDRLGQRWQAAYNSRGQPLRVTLPTGTATTDSYNADGTLASVEIPGRGVYKFAYDAVKRLISRTNPDGSSWKQEYDANDRIVSRTDEDGGVARLDFDGNGVPVRWTDPAGASGTIAYTAMDLPARRIDPLGRNTDFSYDKLNRLASVTAPDTGVASVGYDAPGRPVSLTDAEGKVWRTAYSPEGQAVSFTNPRGEKVSLARDPLGRITKTTTPAGNEFEYSYDAMHRLTRVKDPLGDVTEYRYDAAGRRTAIQLPGGVASAFTRDALGAIGAVTDPNGGQWKLLRDNLGAVAATTDPLGNTTSDSRDSRGRVSKVTWPLGELALRRTPSGRIARAEYSDGTLLEYSYDARQRITAATGVSFAYDARGQLAGSNGIVIERDPVGRIGKLTLAAEKTVSYIYDRRGLVTEIRDWVGGATKFTYDDAGRLATLAYPNGIATRYGYDADGSVTSIEAESLVTIRLERDKTGRVTGAARAVPLGATAGQLARFQRSLGFDAASQVAGFSYDAMGRRTADDQRAYTWDLASRVTSIGAGGPFEYDALHMLTWDGSRRFVWNYALGLPSVAIVRRDDADARYYVHTPGGMLLYSIEADGSRRFFHYDEMGNTLALTDDAGALTDAYAYSPYGGVAASSGVTDNPFTFAGRFGVMRLGASSLYLMRRRIYDGISASFLSRDPKRLLDPRLVNPYQYAAGNPLRYVDPRGNCPPPAAPDYSTPPDPPACPSGEGGWSPPKGCPEGLDVSIVMTDPSFDTVGACISVEGVSVASNPVLFAGERAANPPEGGPDEMGLIDDEVSWFCGLKPNLREDCVRQCPPADAGATCEPQPEYGYDAADRRSQVVDPVGNTRTSPYDSPAGSGAIIPKHPKGLKWWPLW